MFETGGNVVAKWSDLVTIYQEEQSPSIKQTNITFVKWSDLVTIYQEEQSPSIKQTNITYASLYPTNFEKQNVSLFLNIFNAKTVAACDETAVFVEHVTRMWNMLNIKTPRNGTNLNNKDRLPSTLAHNSQFDYLHNMARSLKLMDASINGIIHLIRLLLQKKMSYVLTCEYISDRIGAVFGIWRQMVVTNIYQCNKC